MLTILQSLFEMVHSHRLNVLFVEVSLCEKFIPFLSSVKRNKFKY